MIQEMRYIPVKEFRQRGVHKIECTNFLQITGKLRNCNMQETTRTPMESNSHSLKSEGETSAAR